MTLESREVVLAFGAADANVCARDHRHVALAVGRKIEQPARVAAAERLLDAVDRRGCRDHILRLGLALAINAHEAAERAMVADESVGDRADDARVALAEF